MTEQNSFVVRTSRLTRKFIAAAVGVRRAWLVIGLSFLMLANVCPAQDSATSIVLRADSHAPGKPLKHFWSNIVGAGRANEGLRSSWQEQLKTAASEAGFRYVRFHGLFHDDMFVYHEDHGRPVYNFQYTDDLFDRMLATGVRPFVELGFSPADMVTERGSTGFWWKGNGSPPNNYGKWAELIRRFLGHCIARYGIDEVRSWYFEVWNEPDLHGFFTGTQQQYFNLYETTAKAVKAVDSHLRVGGPATSNFHIDPEVLKKGQSDGADLPSLPQLPTWIPEFLAFCHEHNLPVDFISTHPYPMDFEVAGKTVHRSVNSTRDDLRLLRRMVDSSAYPHAEIHLTEWSSTSSSRDSSHDSLPAAAYVVKCNLDSIGLADSLSYWTFTDVFEEQGAGDTIFHGGFGMINYQGLPKPVFHGYRFMNALGDELLAITPGGIASRESRSGKLAILAYNYPAEMTSALPGTSSMAEADKIADSGSSRSMEIVLLGMPANAPLLIETLDKSHGNATQSWEQMGSPEPPTRQQTEALKAAAWATKKEFVHADSSGRLEVKRSIEAWSLVLVRQL